MADTPSDPTDFFPMSVHYQERLSAAGRTRYRTWSSSCPCIHQLSSFCVFHSLYSCFCLNPVVVSLNEKEGQKTMRFIIRTFTTLLCYVCWVTRLSFLLWLQVLVCRLIDRPLRPTMPKGFYYETQILSWVMQCFFVCIHITYTIIFYLAHSVSLSHQLLDFHLWALLFIWWNNKFSPQVFSYDGIHSPDCVAVTAAGIAMYV